MMVGRGRREVSEYRGILKRVQEIRNETRLAGYHKGERRGELLECDGMGRNSIGGKRREMDAGQRDRVERGGGSLT